MNERLNKSKFIVGHITDDRAQTTTYACKCHELCAREDCA